MTGASSESTSARCTRRADRNWKEGEKSCLGSRGTPQSADWLSQVSPKSLGHLYHLSYHSMFVPGSGRLFVVLSLRHLDPSLCSFPY